MRFIGIPLFASLVLVIAARSYAQEEQRPDEFFDRNYATGQSLIEGDDQLAGKPKAPPTRALPAKKPLKGELEPEDGWVHETGEDSGPASKGTPVNEADVAGNGKPIVSVGAILNRDDVRHFEQSLGKLIKMAERSKVQLGPVYAVGYGQDFSGDFPKLQEKLMALGGDLSYNPEKKDTFKVERSPSWLVETKDGVIVIEGAADIGRYVTTKGEFVEPSGAEAMEGFFPGEPGAPR